MRHEQSWQCGVLRVAACYIIDCLSVVVTSVGVIMACNTAVARRRPAYARYYGYLIIYLGMHKLMLYPLLEG